MHTQPKTRYNLTPPDTPSPPITPPRRDPIAAESYPRAHSPTISSPRSPISPITAASKEEIIRRAIIKIEAFIYEVVIKKNAIATAVNKIAKKFKDVYHDSDDLCRLVIDRAGEETIKEFTTPKLTDAELTQITKNVVRNTGGGSSKKKRRTGKNTKSKTRTRNNSRTIKKMKIRRIRKIIK